MCNDYTFSRPNQLAGLYGYYNTLAEAQLAVILSGADPVLSAEELQSLAQQYLSTHQYAVC